MRRRRRRREAGFSLIEILVVIVLIAIIAAIAVPSFLSTSNKTKARSEVGAIFNDLRMRIEQFGQENGGPTGQFPPNLGEGGIHPASLPSSRKVPILPVPVAWDNIRFQLNGPNEVYCRYTWVTGLGGQSINIGAQANLFGFTVAPTADWYYLLARCNLDDDLSVDSYYFQSSIDPEIRVINEGR
jgi:prepilin-type N-terminal cleavage/methylation domain-containing protein